MMDKVPIPELYRLQHNPHRKRDGSRLELWDLRLPF